MPIRSPALNVDLFICHSLYFSITLSTVGAVLQILNSIPMIEINTLSPKSNLYFPNEKDIH